MSALAAVLAVSAIAQQTPVVRVGPNVRVSRFEVPHVELMLAASPSDASTLIGAAIAFIGPDGGNATLPYASRDAGNTWFPALLPEQVRLGGADPQVAFDATGVAHFATLATVVDSTGRPRAALHTYRSTDAGRTWTGPIDLGVSYDHPQIVVDHRARGPARVYIGVLYGRDYTIGVFHSDDSGLTWKGPTVATRAEGGGLNVTNLLVLSDGALFVPVSAFEIEPEKRAAAESGEFSFVLSRDGGLSFSDPKHIGWQVHGGTSAMELRRERGHVAVPQFPVFAADVRSDRFRDRIYVVWNDYRTGPSRILFSFSEDRGETWSPAAEIAAADHGDQYQPAMAVNRDGIVGILWFDTREAGGTDWRYHAWFTASTDGGRTFQPPARVSTVSSWPLTPENVQPMPSWFPRTDGPARMGTISAGSRWATGGDYMGLAASADGAFHPFWTDSRDGPFQIWTARVEVHELAIVDRNATTLTEASLNREIELRMDPTRFDAANGEAVLPVRLRNASADTLWGPFSVEVVTAGPTGTGSTSVAAPVTILNASNGANGAGAVFDYRDALGDFPYLPPGGVSAALPWRVKAGDPTRTNFNFEVEIRGYRAGR
ncbi:MAG: glycoside hydrolase [Gemmatimonadetes bacterium]|nr:glycoside hydrolase [Gemmatimonadota bacterium]